MDMVAIGTVVLTSREHIIGLEPLGKGLMGTPLRYPYEVRDEKEYFDEIQDVKVTKDMLDLAKHIVNQRASTFQPEKFEDHYEEALTELINAKRQGKTVGPRPRPSGGNVVDLMDALKKSLETEAAIKARSPARPPQARRKCFCRSRGKSPQRRRRRSRSAPGEAEKQDSSGGAPLPLHPHHAAQPGEAGPLLLGLALAAARIHRALPGADRSGEEWVSSFGECRAGGQRRNNC
jgi:hypothetical protein